MNGCFFRHKDILVEQGRTTMAKRSFYLLAFIMFLSMTGYGVVFPALPYLASKLGLNSFQMGSLITGWAFSQFIFVPFWGRLIDRLGRKPVLVFGLTGFGVAFLLMIFAQSYAQLLLIRIIGAMVSTGTMPAVYAMISDVYDKRQRGPAIAKMTAANTFGFLCGPVVGSALSPFGINMPFIVASMLSFVTIPFAIIFLREPNRRIIRKENLSFGKSLGILIKPGCTELFLMTFGLAVAGSGFFSMLGYFMIERFGAHASQTGLAFSTQSFSMVILQLFVMGTIYRKLSEIRIAKIGALIDASGYACVAFSVSVWMIFLGCALIGIGHALVQPTMVSLLSKQDSVGQGMVMGLQQSMDSLGRSVGPLLAGWLFFFHDSAPFFGSVSMILIFLVLFVVRRKAVMADQAVGIQHEYTAK
ncbi:MFS transporter [Sporolactobacillus laevolacticus]|nr:MFS transporter [Sporolactobacillus laevolacticus]MDN3956603.1 MFS transporter [Sporolactobacillus laevolacticus]